MMRRALVCTVMLLGGGPALAQSVSPSVGTLHRFQAGVQATRNCLAFSTASCPSDLRAIPISGIALHGYLDRSSGLIVTIVRAFVGRVVLDEGCASPTPQYQLYLRVTFHNTLPGPVIFDLVGLTVQDQTGRIYNPFGWGDGPPGHAQSQAAHKTRTIWLPYTLGPKPTALSVRWAHVSAGYSPTPRRVALYRVRSTGVKTCQT